MLINRLSQQLKTAESYRTILSLLAKGGDASLSVAQSARAFILAAVFSEHPRPMVLLVPGEETAKRFVAQLQSYLGRDAVLHFASRENYPWESDASDAQQVAKRIIALEALVKGEQKIMVCSSAALLRLTAPPSEQALSPILIQLAQEYEPSDLTRKLLSLGYSSLDGVSGPGTFMHKGDTLEIWPAQEQFPVRLEFFGDELERIRTLIAKTGQTISDLEEIAIYPANELHLTDESILTAKKLLYKRAESDENLSYDLERLEQRVSFEGMEKYLPYLYPNAQSPLAHIHPDTLLVLMEPRALFDDALRSYEDIEARAKNKGESLTGLYLHPRDLNFASFQRLSLLSIMRTGTHIDGSLLIKKPDVNGRNERLTARLKGLCDQDYVVLLAIPDRSARESYELSLSDEGIPFNRTLQHDESDQIKRDGSFKRLSRGLVSLSDIPIASGMIIPDANLAIISIGDLATKHARHSRKSNIDITDITFPFKPGDYVVHSTHGIAHFNDIVRQEVGGHERDYFLLEYAAGDKLYVPLEQLDKITRFIGPNSDKPRLTRLNTSDWTRVSNKARKSAKKLAFDLVDLYTRRSTLKGFKYSPDNSWQREMEEAFPYEPTKDQIHAIEDIKADMESDKPMDRLLGGDVGFGKTEVAMRAAFKAVQDNKQVMILCPTTILAQQHFETFFERFAPFNIEVEVLSRFRTASQQKRALEGFANGSVSVLIGTHRLLSNDVNPKDLGLVIIDEEQRFGVGHKEQLKTLREQLDVLTLSATPIPRTMQMAMSGVREMSLIKTPPQNRLPVKVHVGEWDENLVALAIRHEIQRGGQAYYVSNRVKTIDEVADKIVSAVPEARVGIAHGQMSERELEKVMESFAVHETDVLLATTIIESGIDNPHTNTLIIEDSQRLGLAQLYQLKGRVGRGRTQAYAYFMFPEGETLTQTAFNRLTAIEEFQELGSGMDIAMRDLEIRGAGSLMGAEQSGNLSSVGFDLFTQMLGEAVSEARGEGEVQEREVALNVSVDYYLSEEYIPEADKRVRAYRQLASAVMLEQLDKLEQELICAYGNLEPAGNNLLNRERIKIRASRLGISSIALVSGKLVFSDIDISAELKEQFRKRGAIYYPKSKKLQVPYKLEKDEILTFILDVLSQVGGSDEMDDEDDE